jgi:hypothetical protein
LARLHLDDLVDRVLPPRRQRSRDGLSVRSVPQRQAASILQRSNASGGSFWLCAQTQNGAGSAFAHRRKVSSNIPTATLPFGFVYRTFAAVRSTSPGRVRTLSIAAPARR